MITLKLARGDNYESVPLRLPTTDVYKRQIQETMLDIKKKYGKNAILKGMNLEEGATAKERNLSLIHIWSI